MSEYIEIDLECPTCLTWTVHARVIGDPPRKDGGYSTVDVMFRTSCRCEVTPAVQEVVSISLGHALLEMGIDSQYVPGSRGAPQYD